MQRSERKVAVGLVRCSTDMQEHSIEDQEIEIRKWAKDTGHELIMVFRDEGVSGSELNRPGMRALFTFLESSPEKGTLVAWHRSRLARPEDPRQGIALELKIEDLGWTIHFLSGTPNSGNVLVDAMLGLIDHHKNGQYLKDLSGEVLRTQLHRITDGDVPGGKVPYGYVKVVTDSAGDERTILRTTKHRKLKEERVRWEPGDEAEVKTVRRIFELYVGGRGGFSEIASQLNTDRRPAPTGGKWVSGTIRDILTNPLYIGDLIWNKETSSKFFRIQGGKVLLQDRARESKRPGKDRRKTTYRRNVEADWIRIERHHTPLIERSLFERARELMQKRGSRQGRHRGQRPVHPLSGRVFCACCKNPMYGRTTTAKERKYRKYSCSSYELNRDCAPNAVHAGPLEAATLFVLKEELLPKDRPIESLRDQFTAIIRRNMKLAPTADRSALRKERDALDAKVTTALENMGVIGKETAELLAGQIRAWRTRKDEIDQVLAHDAALRETQQVVFEKAEDAADELIGVLRDLARLDKDATLDEKRGLFERTVRKVEVEFKTVNPTDGRKRGRHVPLGADVQTIDLLGVAQEVALNEKGLLG